MKIKEYLKCVVERDIRYLYEQEQKYLLDLPVQKEIAKKITVNWIKHTTQSLTSTLRER